MKLTELLPVKEFPFTSSRIPKLVGCFGFNGPLRQYFSLYRAVSQREGEKGEKGRYLSLLKIAEDL